jgi:transposase-like protein
MSRRRHTDKEMARIIREFEHHQGSTADFCRQRGISSQTFTKWLKSTDSSLASKDEPPEFLAFEIGATHDRQAPAGPLVEFELGGGMVRRILPARL